MSIAALSGPIGSEDRRRPGRLSRHRSLERVTSPAESDHTKPTQFLQKASGVAVSHAVSNSSGTGSATKAPGSTAGKISA